MKIIVNKIRKIVNLYKCAWVADADANDLQKYYHPATSICACTMRQSKKGLQKVTILWKMQYFVSLSLLISLCLVVS